ncbi:MAG: alpha/beta fold hydrolase [Rhizobiaceae bacterium]|nr:alpha/beta fold hydrolase [Rhizobiaceae bacterium]MCV0405464.1 alpha/beta fold hydrolase [Rhizobiaceae bacterium]
MARARKLEFEGHSGAQLAARLDLPDGPPRAFALFAHCFTCSKDLLAVRRIAAELARQGIAVLRFDFTGLGASEGEFASTDFSSNVDDLVSAADYLGREYEAPSILIGHSLGGAAVLCAASRIEAVRAVVTIAAPSDVAHVLKNFGSSLDRIEADGKAEVALEGRRFTIRKEFVDDARQARLAEHVTKLRKALLVMHSPVDDLVGIDHASAIFQAAKHPKSFISLDRADHLLTDPADAAFAASVIAGWVGRYLPADRPQGEAEIEHVRVSETGEGKFQAAVLSGRHRLFTDEPEKMGGLDSGPSPYDFLSMALGACTSMTLRMYADHKKLRLGRVSVDISHAKVHARDCAECTDDEKQGGGRIDRFERAISVEGDIDEEFAEKLGEIADKCPVHRTLTHGAKVATLVRRHISD